MNSELTLWVVALATTYFEFKVHINKTAPPMTRKYSSVLPQSRQSSQGTPACQGAGHHWEGPRTDWIGVPRWITQDKMDFMEMSSPTPDVEKVRARTTHSFGCSSNFIDNLAIMKHTWELIKKHVYWREGNLRKLHSLPGKPLLHTLTRQRDNDHSGQQPLRPCWNLDARRVTNCIRKQVADTHRPWGRPSL